MSTKHAAAGAPLDAGAEAADDHLREQHLSSETLVSGGFLELRRDAVRLANGMAATREYIAHPGAVAVVPLLDDGRIVLVRQYRYPVAKVLVELPAGKRDAGETTLACAMRELAEETGYRAREWAYAGAIHNAAAYSTESIWIWFARGLEAGPRQLDPGEVVDTVLLSEPQLEALDLGGELSDVKTLIGLHWLQSWRAGRRQLSFTSADHAPPL
jgi:ADP-ribose pyrophosphatase